MYQKTWSLYSSEGIDQNNNINTFYEKFLKVTNLTKYIKTIKAWGGFQLSEDYYGMVAFLEIKKGFVYEVGEWPET